MCNTSIEVAKVEAWQEIEARQEFREDQERVARLRGNDARMQGVMSRASGRVSYVYGHIANLNQSQSCVSVRMTNL